MENMREVVLGVDIGTSSSKGVLVGFDGRIEGLATRHHDVDRPLPGHVEMDPDLWWEEFESIARELSANRSIRIVGVGVSGMGPCAAITDEAGAVLRPAILYGVDTRAGEQIAQINDKFGPQSIVERCGSSLSSQAILASSTRLRPRRPTRPLRFPAASAVRSFRRTRPTLASTVSSRKSTSRMVSLSR